MASVAALRSPFLLSQPLHRRRCSSKFTYCRSSSSSSSSSTTTTATRSIVRCGCSRNAAQDHEEDATTVPALHAAAAAAAASVSLLLSPEAAMAVDGEFGILEGRSFALVHPIVMGGLLAYTLWAGYLGWQWRQVRTIQADINELKKQVPPKKAAEEPPSEVELKIERLTQTRKELVKGGFRDRHYNAGSILLGLGVTEAVGGCVNTWFRTGKLFPGPHLFAGAGITVLWAVAAALVPAMQRGNETARNLHIALNTINVALFLSQLPTGFDIVLKVFEFTTWP